MSMNIHIIYIYKINSLINSLMNIRLKTYYTDSVLVFNSKVVIILFCLFINLFQKYDWNILCLLNSSYSFLPSGQRKFDQFIFLK